MHSSRHITGAIIGALLFLLPTASVSAATLFLTPDTSAVGAGQSFTVDLKINSAGVGFNGAQATINFPPNLLQATADKSASDFNFWLEEPVVSNTQGSIEFIGGTAYGLSGSAIQVLRLTFTPKGTGSGRISIVNGAITASDGSGTNILSTTTDATFLVSPARVSTQPVAVVAQPQQITRPAAAAVGLPALPNISVPLYPNQDAWYSNISKFIVQWILPADVTAVATAINQQPAFDPAVSEGLFNNKTFAPIQQDGVWYLHVRFKNNIGWGPTLHYRIGIDTAPPLPFTVTSSDGLTSSNVAPTLHFSTKDQPSGIEAYRVLINNVVATTTAASVTSYTIPPQSPGKKNITVQAIDYAGNITESRITVTILEVPLITIAGIGITQFWFFAFVLAALCAGVAIGLYFSMLERQQRKRRIVIAQRDIQAAFSSIKKDTESIMQKCGNASLSQQKSQELTFMLARMSDNIEKLDRYILQNVEEIG